MSKKSAAKSAKPAPPQDEPQVNAPAEESTFDETYREYVGKFWKGNTYIPGYGHVRGQATEEQITAFLNVAKEGEPLDNWLADTDVHKKWEKDHSRKNNAN